jgi:hypothetical protein
MSKYCFVDVNNKKKSSLEQKGLAKQKSAGKNLYRATPAVTQGLDFSGIIRSIVPF